MKINYHPNPALNQGFQYQYELELHLNRLKTAPESDHYLDALLQSVVAFREALKSGDAVVPGEKVFSQKRRQQSRGFV